jgi:uncharacterized membrane protein YagU involved in acid resistance
MEEILHNMSYISFVMPIIIFLITNVLKLPIKALTTKLISNETTKKRVNTIICIIPFALGIVFEIVYCTHYLNEAYSIIRGLNYGTNTILLYHIFEHNFKTKIYNPFETEQGQEVMELVEEITADGKIDEKDMDAIQKFWDSVK